MLHENHRKFTTPVLPLPCKSSIVNSAVYNESYTHKNLRGPLIMAHRVYRVVQKKNCTKFNAPSFCKRLQQNNAVFAKMLKKITVYQSM